MAIADKLWWLPFGSVPEVAPRDLHGRITSAAPPQLLDVRTRAEWRNGHIRGAVSAPITSLGSLLDELALDPERPVVAICLTAHRSIPAVRLLRQHGFADVAQLEGGMQAWWSAGLPTEVPQA